MYVGLPPEISIFLCYPESITPDQNIKKYINSLKHFEKNSIELSHAKDLFLKLFPELKLEFGNFLNNLSYIRNSSVHSSVPDFKRYELNSIAYHSTKLFVKLDSLNQLGYLRIQLDIKTTEFLQNYKEDKIKKVKMVMKNATDFVSTGKFSPDNSFNIRDWQSMPIECPICGCFATLFGQSEYQCNMNEDEILVFNAESLHCASCNLKLEDYEELILANIEASQDRDHDLEDWKIENGDFDEDGNFYPYL